MSFAARARRAFFVLTLALAAAVCVYGGVRLVRDFVIHPRIESVYPHAGDVGVDLRVPVRLTFNKSMSARTILPATLALQDEHGAAVPGSVTYDDSTHTARLLPASALQQGSTYEVAVRKGILDRYNRPLVEEKRWRFTTGIEAAGSPAEGPGGPILLVTSRSNGFSQYYAEILRNEGLNEFDVKDLADVSSAELAQHDIVLLGEMPVDDDHVRMFMDWVRGGGKLITMRPAQKLAEALGLSLAASDSDGPVQHSGYLKIDAKAAAGSGLVQRPIQFHGDADRFVSEDATVLATLYKDGKTATPYPAVRSLHVGSGTAIVFSYDLAKSVVYTRQGNPEWSGVERDGIAPVRSDDLFYGASEKDPQPDWVDTETIAIPQADMQQRLLANLMILSSAGREPLPHFWYLPRGLKAVIVMTGDDHGHGGTIGRFRHFARKSPDGCSLENWECIRATSNIFVGSISTEEAAYFAKEGFEIGLHVFTACTDWPTKTVRGSDGVDRRQVVREAADALYTQQLQGFAAKYPGVPAPVSNRTDCITWGDYDTQPQVELSHQIRLDTNYYYWPPKWVKDKPGLFTGSAMPMRFARQDGRLIDVYQATTQMTDESGQSYPYTVDTLLGNALGSEEYFGVLTANMHNDLVKSRGADAILASAEKHHVPVITAAQLLQWLDGRNASRFRNLTWLGNRLSFSIEVGIGGNGIEAMLPVQSAVGDLASVSLNGTAVQWQKRSVAGIDYAVFAAAPGTFSASYGHSVGNAVASSGAAPR
ncbi:Ig-like domain-containing protein [Silvibacterium acidisoli]|uniref:Ig-like domain-containing protein n=1 Tax=Acidobacteriaceae bacterium ZG23-2 TaxID=2883246 RepID=UPI00406C70D0